MSLLFDFSELGFYQPDSFSNDFHMSNFPATEAQRSLIAGLTHIHMSGQEIMHKP